MNVCVNEQLMSNRARGPDATRQGFVKGTIKYQSGVPTFQNKSLWYIISSCFLLSFSSEQMRKTLTNYEMGKFLHRCAGCALWKWSSVFLSVGLEYRDVVMVPWVVVISTSRNEIWLYENSGLNTIPGKILFRKSTNAVNSSSLPDQMRNISSIYLIHFFTCMVNRGDG